MFSFPRRPKPRAMQRRIRTKDWDMSLTHRTDGLVSVIVARVTGEPEDSAVVAAVASLTRTDASGVVRVDHTVHGPVMVSRYRVATE